MENNQRFHHHRHHMLHHLDHRRTIICTKDHVPKPIDKTKQRTQRPKNRKPELKVVNKTGKNYFKIQPKARVLQKYTRKCVYKCPFPKCNVKRDNLSSLNAHYRIKHPPLACSKCNKNSVPQVLFPNISIIMANLNILVTLVAKSMLLKAS